MRRALCALLLLAGPCLASEPPLRFAVSESWTMPLMRLDNGVPSEGILYDIMRSLARQVGTTAELHVLARLRMQAAMERGDVDIRCYTAQSWAPNLSGDYIWSLPLIEQRDVLVGRPGAVATSLDKLAGQPIGTVLGYYYAPLEASFAKGRFTRDDARNQDQVLLKLQAGRYRYAVSNEMSLNWFNRQKPGQPPLPRVALLEAQKLGCYARNDPQVPVQRVLRTLLRMKMNGEIDRIIDSYTLPPAP